MHGDFLLPGGEKRLWLSRRERKGDKRPGSLSKTLRDVGGERGRGREREREREQEPEREREREANPSVL